MSPWISWVFLAVESHFTINLEALSFVLYGLRSLDAIVRSQVWIPEAGDLNFGPSENSSPWNINRQEPTQSPPAQHRPSTTQEPASYSSGCHIPILQQNMSTTLHINRQSAQIHCELTDTPKHTTGHSTAGTPERQDPAPSTRTQAQVPPTRKPSQDTGPNLPMGNRLHS